MLLNCFLRIPKVLFQTTSPVSGEIKVVQKGRERELLVNGICQSINFDAPGIEDCVWGRVAALAKRKFKPLRFKNALILGLGAGTVARLLVRQFPGTKIDGVELDPAIINIGRRFFDLDKIPSLNVICADALNVVGNYTRYKIPNTKYDLVIADLYCGGRFPKKFAQGEFLSNVKGLTAPGGLAVFNRIFRRGRRNELNGFIEKVGRVFGKVELAEVQGPHGFANLLVVANC